MIGQWLAASTPDRLTHAVLANTSPRFADPGPMEARRKTVLESGMSAIADAVLGRFFSPGPLSANPPHVASTRRTLLDTNPTGYAGCCAAIRDMDQRALLPEIELPTLVVSGHHDVSTPWIGHGEVLASSIGGASVVHLPAAHLSNLERPRSFSAALLDFLLPADADDPIHSGLTVRRAALGEAHVDRSLATATDFNRDFQELITRYAWGSVWARPGLDPRTRRLLVLAITASLGRWEEFRLHLRAGLERELEPCDVKEVLLQTAIYAGVPAANTAFKMAAEETLAARV
jgi:3-oxoadipate enol-lactonase / 4-carboxymuconolactone decarboxylase